MKSGEVDLRDVFVSAVKELVSREKSGVPATCTGMICHCLNKVRKVMGMDPVRKSLNDLFISLEKDIREEEVQSGDLVFFETMTPRELVNVEVVVDGKATVSAWQGQVQTCASYKRTFGFPTHLHFRSISRWLQRSLDIVRIRTTFRGFRVNHTYALTNGNNSALVQQILESWGWKKTQLQASSGLIWTQTIRQVEVPGVKEGSQLVNHIPKLHLVFTTKKSLRHSTKSLPNFPVPLTFDLSDQFDYASFMSYGDTSSRWILKPYNLNQGIGISLVTNLPQFRRDLISGKESRAKIVQLYIERPLLLSGHKFDIRYYILIARCKPLICLRYDVYYIRRSLNKYRLNSENLLTHLTNAHQQKSHPEFNSRKEESIWSKLQFQEKLGTAFTDKIERGMVETLGRLLMQVGSRIEQKLGCFELLGVDFMLDDDNRLYLIEVNVNPAIYTDTRVLGEVIPRLVTDTLTVVRRIHEGDSSYLSNTLYKPLLPPSS